MATPKLYEMLAAADKIVATTRKQALVLDKALDDATNALATMKTGTESPEGGTLIVDYQAFTERHNEMAANLRSARLQLDKHLRNLERERDGRDRLKKIIDDAEDAAFAEFVRLFHTE